MFTKLDKLLHLFGGRCIIVEDGEPKYVVLALEEYFALRGEKASPARGVPSDGTNPGLDAPPAPDGGMADLDEINREIEMMPKDDVAVPAPTDDAPPEKPKTEYRVEDIPF